MWSRVRAFIPQFHTVCSMCQIPLTCSRYCTLCLLQMFSANAKHKVACPICLVPFHMASTKPIAITISGTNSSVASSCRAYPSSAASVSAVSAPASVLGRVSFSLLQRWRGSNCPVLVSHSIKAEQVGSTNIMKQLPEYAHHTFSSILNLSPTGACVAACGYQCAAFFRRPCAF